jgi:hypothetical protein
MKKEMINLQVTVEQWNALQNMCEEKQANAHDCPAGHPGYDDDATFFAALYKQIEDSPGGGASSAMNLEDMRWVSFARCWWSLNGGVRDVEFPWFKRGFDCDDQEHFDSVLIREIKAQAKAEGHKYPEQIEDTLRVMLHG